jgi:hypothetical protein
VIDYSWPWKIWAAIGVFAALVVGSVAKAVRSKKKKAAPQRRK